MPSDSQTALIMSLIGAAGGIASGMGQAKMSEQDRAFTGQQNALSRQFQGKQNSAQLLAQLLSSQYGDSRSDSLSRDRMSMDASQLDPLANQRARGSFALQGDKVRQWSPTTAKFDYDSGMGSFQGGYNNMKPSEFTKSFYTPEAMAGAEMGDFQSALQRLNPGAPVHNAYGAAGAQGAADVTAMGQGLMADRKAETDAYMTASQKLAQQMADQEKDAKTGPPPAGYEYDKKTGQLKKKGSSWLKKLGKVGLIAGAGLATAFTGGAAAPLLSAATKYAMGGGGGASPPPAGYGGGE